MSGGPVIFVDDDPDLRRATTQVLTLAGFEVQAFEGAEAALAALDDGFAGPIVTDIRMPRMNGLQLFQRIKALDSELPVLLVTGHGDVELAVAALKDGAYDFISKPFDGERLATAVAHAAEKRRLVLENRRLRAAAAEVPADLPLIGDAPGIRRLRETIRQVADADVDVLVLGETGSGKEVVARLLHDWSRRKARQPRRAQLRRAARDGARERALRARGRRLHRRRPQARRPDRARERRHAVPRRDRVLPAGDPGQAAARARDPRGRAARHQRAPPARPARRRGDQGRPRRSGRARRLPRGSRTTG